MVNCVKKVVHTKKEFEESEEELILIPPGGNWHNYETLYRNWGKCTMLQLNRVSAMTRQGENPLKWIMAQPDAEVQYKLLMQEYLIRGLDRPTVRSWVKVSKSEIKQMHKLHSEGLSVERIALLMNRCRGTVWHCLAREAKVSIYSEPGRHDRLLTNSHRQRSYNKAMPYTDVQKVRELYAQGIGYKKIGKLMNRHPKTIYDIVKGKSYKGI